MITETAIPYSYQVLGIGARAMHKWSVESVHTKNIVSILHLLVSKIYYYNHWVYLDSKDAQRTSCFFISRQRAKSF